MQLETREVNDVVVVRVVGDITLGKGGDVLLKDKINSLLQQGHRKILVDLGQVSYVDSAGLGQLVSVHATATRHGASLKLLNVTKRLRDLLVVTKLLTVFDTFDTEAAALQEFAKTTGV
jgi:anti-sigma B factor antagonist